MSEMTWLMWYRDVGSTSFIYNAFSWRKNCFCVAPSFRLPFCFRAVCYLPKEGSFYWPLFPRWSISTELVITLWEDLGLYISMESWRKTSAIRRLSVWHRQMTAMCHEQGLKRANLRARVQRCLKGNIHSPKLHFLLITTAILFLQFMALGATVCMSTIITNLHQQLTYQLRYCCQDSSTGAGQGRTSLICNLQPNCSVREDPLVVHTLVVSVPSQPDMQWAASLQCREGPLRHITLHTELMYSGHPPL